MRWLLDHRADLREEKEGIGPVQAAIVHGHLVIVELLMASSTVCWRSRPLNCACYSGHAGIVRQLLKMRGDMTMDAEGLSPLHCAAHTGHLAVVKMLLDLGAEVNAGSTTGRTPVFAACQHGHLEIVRLAVSWGVLPRAFSVEFGGRSGFWPQTCVRRLGLLGESALPAGILARGLMLGVSRRSGGVGPKALENPNQVSRQKSEHVRKLRTTPATDGGGSCPAPPCVAR